MAFFEGIWYDKYHTSFLSKKKGRISISQHERQKRAAVIEDISGAGRCSLTVALPILSVSGVQCSVLPTAVLSTHPGGYTGYTYRDLTTDLLPAARHWKREGLKFDAFYSGFLASVEQVDSIEQIFDMYCPETYCFMVDPVMGDNGKYYRMFDSRMADALRRLCQKATILTPNLTEACFLTGVPYREGPYTSAYIDELLDNLAAFRIPQIALTGVSYQPHTIGVVCLETEPRKTSYIQAEAIEGYYHGTGDVFAATLLAGLLHGRCMADSAQIAVDFTSRCIRRTAAAGTPVREGLLFEEELLWLGETLSR